MEIDMTKGTLLIIGSNATQLDVQGGTRPVGQYLNETVVPVLAAKAAGYEVVLATPDGRKPHIDPVSDTVQHFGGDEAAFREAQRFFAEDPAMNQVRSLRAVIADGLDGYSGLFVPGGHAPVVDLMQDEEAGEIFRHFHAASKPTALLCHGPIAIVSALPEAASFRAALVAGDAVRARDLAKGWIYADYEMTVFSESEEKIVEENLFKAKMYFAMPEALRTAGGKVVTGAQDFAAHVVVDRELITGQNPRSDHLLAARLVEALARAAVSA
jgi:putative intracellular protease/amidase